MAAKSLLDTTPQTSYRLDASLNALLKADPRVQSYMNSLSPEQRFQFNPVTDFMPLSGVGGTKRGDNGYYNWQTFDTQEEADKAAQSIYDGLTDDRINEGLGYSKSTADRYVRQQKPENFAFGMTADNLYKTLGTIYLAAVGADAGGLLGGESAGGSGFGADAFAFSDGASLGTGMANADIAGSSLIGGSGGFTLDAAMLDPSNAASGLAELTQAGTQAAAGDMAATAGAFESGLGNLPEKSIWDSATDWMKENPKTTYDLARTGIGLLAGSQVGNQGGSSVNTSTAFTPFTPNQFQYAPLVPEWAKKGLL